MTATVTLTLTLNLRSSDACLAPYACYVSRAISLPLRVLRGYIDYCAILVIWDSYYYGLRFVYLAKLQTWGSTVSCCPPLSHGLISGTHAHVR